MRELSFLLLIGLCGCSYSLPLRVTDGVTGRPIAGARVGCQESRRDSQWRLHQLTWWETANEQGHLQFDGLRRSYSPTLYFLSSDYRRATATFSAGERCLLVRDAPFSNDVGRVIGRVFESNAVFTVSLEPSK